MSAWTEGPWRTDTDDEGDELIVAARSPAYPEEQMWVAEVYTSVADARLIAAAPAMYEALREMVDKGEGCVTGRDDCGPDCCRYGRARAALSAAEGRQGT